MWKKVSLLATVLLAAACTSAPQVKYPTGNANRIPLNRAPVGTPLLGVASAQRVAPVLPTIVPAVELMPPAIAAEPPPEPMRLGVYVVNPSEHSLMNVMRRWARIDRVDFGWYGFVDYPITERMRQINATSLEDAFEQVKETLVGVRVPLSIVFDKELGWNVRPGIVVAPAPQAEEKPVAAAAVAIAAVAPAAAGSSPIAIPPASNVPTVDKPPVPVLSRWPVTNTDRTLFDVMTRWSQLGGARLQWDSKAVLPVSDAVRNNHYAGTFVDALGQLAGSFADVQTPVGMKFLDQGAVLRVYDLAEVK